jgi:hypothetical protein
MRPQIFSAFGISYIMIAAANRCGERDGQNDRCPKHSPRLDRIPKLWKRCRKERFGAFLRDE